ncbi:Sulfite exporter TauE/SafE [Planctomycetes bacterium Pan216]|uniref:Probable membrane transporter protein n=1 Tax=Kolteria novifilia TaxID=2527975 RepID=A0A518BCK2_9BACT|nr:Sulfite exporter TauE/SafE [Planctomycetes bacterium Pan216]
MSVGLISLLIAIGSFGAGFLGALTGLGGGVVIVPMLTLFMGVDIRYAIGASLVSVIGTSSATGATYVRDGYSNIRVGMFLEVATTAGAIGGAFLAVFLPIATLSIVMGIVLILSAYLSVRKKDEQADPQPSRLANRLRLHSSYPTPEGPKSYHVTGVPGGFIVMAIAGALSGLLGIGSGALKVLAMDHAMKLPFKVSTTTSNFMTGVTAAASAGIYLHRGYIDPIIAMPVILGILVGATLGARVLKGAKPKALRYIFAVVIVLLGVQMLYHGFSGGFDSV